MSAPICPTIPSDRVSSILSQPSWRKNVASNLAFRFLIPENESDRADAFDGLVALAFQAKGDILIYPTPDEVTGGSDIVATTRACVIDSLLQIFSKYAGKSVTEILDAIAADKFRYIGRQVRADLINEIDRRHRAWKKRIRTVHVNADAPAGSGDDETSDPRNIETLSAREETMLDDSTPTARQDDNFKYMEFLRENGAALAVELGRDGKESLAVIERAVSLYPDICEAHTPRHIEADILDAVQRWEQISARSAKRRKAKLRRAIQGANQRQQGKILNDLFELIAYGHDKNTAVFKFTSPDGRRRRVVKVRISEKASR